VWLKSLANWNDFGLPISFEQGFGRI